MIDKIINWTSLVCSITLVLMFFMLFFIPLDVMAIYFIGVGTLGVISSLIRIKRA